MIRLSKNKVILWSVLTFGVVVVAPWLSFVVDDLQLLAFVWPYPLMLTLQTWVNIDAYGTWLVLDVIGVIIVTLWAIWMNKKWGVRFKNDSFVTLCISLSWIFPLGVIQVLMMVTIGVVLGYPVGE